MERVDFDENAAHAAAERDINIHCIFRGATYSVERNIHKQIN